MNLLAHAFLGFDNAELITGQIAGDFVKGPDLSEYSTMIAAGIQMHRQLDVWTDRHPVFKRSCNRFPRSRRRVAGILVDLAYDHSLARFWSNYCHQDLVEYAGFVYLNLERFKADLPTKMSGFIRRVPKIRLLESYRDAEGLRRAINHVATRLKKPELLHGAFEEVQEMMPVIDSDFKAFFPHAIKKAVLLAPNPDKLEIYGDSQSRRRKIEVFAG